MPTIGEAVSRLEEQLFVGRERELGLFREWLDNGGERPALLHVSGPGGAGKTWLLRAFGRAARSEGRAVIYADGRTLVPTPEGLRRALAADPGRDPVVALNEQRPVLMLDTFEELAPCETYLREELLERLDASVRVVLAGRTPLGRAWQPWTPFVRTVSLAGLTAREAREYLARRSIIEPAIVESILSASGCHPLALSVAADLNAQYKVREFHSAPEWRLTLRNLVENLLAEANDPELRELLEAASIVRQFDETTLAAVTGQEDISEGFARLCRLSVVRPSEHGLMVHDDVRPILVEDLRWRRPTRYDEFRTNAAAYYVERMRIASPADAAWLVADQFFFLGLALLRALYFAEAEPGAAWVDTSDPPELPDLRAVDRTAVGPPTVVPPPEELCEGFVTELAASRAAKFQVARDREGRALAYGFTIAINEPSMRLLPADGAIAMLVRRCLERGEIAALPPSVDDESICYLSSLRYSGEDAEQAVAVLGQWVMARLLESDIFLVYTASPLFKGACLAMGFEAVSGTRVTRGEDEEPYDGLLLDKTLISNEDWIDCVAHGQPVPRLPKGATLEQAIGAVLDNWSDDAALGASPLSPLAAVRCSRGTDRAQAVRELVSSTLEPIASKGESERLAARALSLGYVEGVTHDAAASRLSVSRATFYRLRRRGIEALAAELCGRVRR